MSAPHVTGLIALLLHRNPDLTNTEIREYITKNATKPPPDTPPDDMAGWGAGKANAFAAMEKLKATKPAVNAPVPIVATEPVAPTLYEQLMETERGEELEGLFRTYGHEVFTLINKNKRVATAWHRLKGPVWVRHALRAAFNEGFTLPPIVDGIRFKEAIEKFSAVVKEYASAALNEMLVAYKKDLDLITPELTIKELIDLIGNRRGDKELAVADIPILQRID
jgi:hypothetical protein